MIATAGHVDHGKSTLVRALTGMEPDRWAEERRRGMTIDLGYAWTTLPSGQQVAFVDVPGHERFTTNMLAGVGPVPAVLLVVAADEGWAAQTDEHVRALDALRVERGLLAVTRSDLADPGPATEQTLARLAETSLAGIAAVSVSGATGEGIDELRTALDALAASLPRPDPAARIRLWIDRSFTIKGSGTVVTGTLGSGTLRRGDVLELAGERVSVRALQRLGEPADVVQAPARVAVNLRGVPHDHVHRGDALLTPDTWRRTSLVDLRFDGRELPSHVVLHIGSAAVAAKVRRIGGEDASDAGTLARLTLEIPLPLAVGDRMILRDPGLRHVLGGAIVLDPLPPALRRRGAARARAAALRTETGKADAASEVARRGAVSRSLLDALGVPIPDPVPAGIVLAAGWLIDAARWDRWREALRSAVSAHPGNALLDNGIARPDMVRLLHLPEARLLDGLVASCPDVEDAEGKLRARGVRPSMRADLEASISQLTTLLEQHPFNAPEQADLASLRLGRAELGAAASAGAILRLPGDIVLLPNAPQQATTLLRALPQPFTLSAARQALSTTRRVAVPLLEHLDRIGLTVRVDEGLRRLRA
ncbi:MAG TPA: selenocysteine-specific translation elongation factor [Candidatus Dormibacteraeota bacterium]